MSRTARTLVAGHPHHVTQRSNRRAPVFVDNNDRRDYPKAHIERTLQPKPCARKKKPKESDQGMLC